MGSKLREVTVIKGTVKFDLVLAGQTVPSINTFIIQAKGSFDSRLAAATNTATLLTWKIASAIDTKPPVISGQTPANNSTVSIAQPTISALYKDSQSGIDVTKTRLLLDGVDVTGNATVTLSGINYLPTLLLTAGSHILVLNVADRVGNSSSSTWSFNIAGPTADTLPPVISTPTPVNGSYTLTKSPLIGAQYADAGSGVDATKVQLLLDGVDVTGTATITATGITYQSANLAEGTHQLALTVYDIAGNLAQAAWQFAVDTALPSISAQAPANGSYAPTSTPTISAQYSDAGSGVDATRALLTLDGTSVAYATTASGITYVPSAPLLAGVHQVVFTVYDKAGNLAQATWQFTVDTLPPVISAQTPVNGSYPVTTTPIISASFQDAGIGMDASRTLLTLDGVDITAAATATVGSISYTATTLAAGTHQVVLTVLDLAGNMAQSSWNFTIDNTPPVVGVQMPLNTSYIASAAPAITAQYQDNESGVDASKVQLLLDAVDVSATSTITANGITYQSANLSEGVHQLALSVYDRVGNPAFAAWQFTVDTVAPAISATTPVNGATLANSTPLVSAQYADANSGINLSKVILTQDGLDVTNSAIITATDLSYQSATTLTQGSHHIGLTVVDKAGNSSQSAWDFLIDSKLTTEAIVPATTPSGVAATAVVTIVIPDPNVVRSSVVLQQLDAQGRPTVIGRLHDDGLQGDTLANDQTYTLSFSIYEQNPGNLTYRVSAEIQGQLTPLLSNLLTFNVSGTVGTGITVTQPADLAFFNTGTIIVTGTISDPAASVVINGISANISGNNFQASIPLQEGYNPITAVATNSNGTSATASVQVTLDTTPPKVTVIAPVAGYSTTEPAITVTGIVNDIVVGTVNDQQASVTVNGIAAQVTNRTYTAPDIPLQLGANTLRIVALDRTGNSATQSINVTRTAAVGTVVKMISGNNQTGTIATPVAAPLVVQILNGITPIANVPVIFKVTQNDATLQPGAPQSTIVIVNTGATGLAQASLTLGNHAGAGNNVVEAYSTGAQGIAVFTASGMPKEASLISVDSGNNQFGAVNQPLILPLVAVVTDPGFNRLGGIPVTFLSKQGFGTFNGASSFETVTDSDGRAAASLTLGTQPGLDNNIIEAYVTASLTTGNLGYPAAFTASGKLPGDPLNTRISGIVQDNSGQPIPDVTMRLYQANLGTHNNEQTEVIPPVITDASGHFTLSATPVGLFKLMADGKTAISGGKNYPTLEYDIVTVAGQDNTLGMPIYLPALDPLSTLCVDQTTGGTLTVPSAPGFALTIQPGAATFPGGAKSGCVSVTPVNPDKMPMAPGFGQQPRYIVTIQPVGTSFNPPAALTIPNLDGLAPHAKTEMYSYDHDLAAFVAIGSATVSADGSTIASDPGIGVMKAGWHCGGNPNTTGSVGTCPTCKKCQGSGCVADDGQIPPQTSPTDCKLEICSGGFVGSQNKDAEKPAQDCRICKNGAPELSANGSNPNNANSCCFNGQALAKLNIPYDTLIAQCPTRTQVADSIRRHAIDGCTTSPDDLESWDNLPFAINYDLYVTNPIWGIDLGGDNHPVSNLNIA